MKIRLSCVLVLALFLGACQTHRVDSRYPQLIIGPKAGSYLSIESVQEGMVSTDLLRAGVRLYNVSATERELRYRFEWLDENGFEIPGLAARWSYVKLRSGIYQSLAHVATSPHAVGYRIHLFDVSTPVQNHANRHRNSK